MLVPAALTVGLVVVGLITRSLWATRLDGAITVVDGASRVHVRGPVAYDRVPAVGGDHAPMWQRCGVYDVAVPDERAVDSLARRAVWITYRPRASEDTVAVVDVYAQSPRGAG